MCVILEVVTFLVLQSLSKLFFYLKFMRHAWPSLVWKEEMVEPWATELVSFDSPVEVFGEGATSCSPKKQR